MNRDLVFPSKVGDLIRDQQKSFPWFLLATLLPILLMPFTNLDGNIFERICLPLVTVNLVVQSLRIMPRRSKQLPLLGGWLPYRALGGYTAIGAWVPYLIGNERSTPLAALIVLGFVIFYALTAIRIIQILAKVEGVNGRTLCLGAAGYIHLGLTAGLLATLLQITDPNSFSLGAMLPGSELVERLTYFCFVTLGSIGYGDILPTTAEAEFFAVCLSIIGTLYVSLMIGLLLSRYINDQSVVIAESVANEKEHDH
jgi:voltage-gated potassium channel